MTHSPWTLRGALREGWEAARKNAKPIILIQAVAAAIVVAYYVSPDFRRAAEAVGPWRAKFGLPLTFVMGFVAGGLIPELAKLATRQVSRLDLKHLLFVGSVFGFLGMQIDLFYAFQSVLWGHGTDVATIAKKLAIDMGLAAPLLFIPYTVGMFLWREAGFRLRAIPGFFSWKVYRERVLSIQVMNWFVWIPVLCAIYALPLALQLPLSMLIEACWTLLLVVMASKDPGAEATPG